METKEDGRQVQIFINRNEYWIKCAKILSDISAQQVNPKYLRLWYSGSRYTPIGMVDLIPIAIYRTNQVMEKMAAQFKTLGAEFMYPKIEPKQ